MSDQAKHVLLYGLVMFASARLFVAGLPPDVMRNYQFYLDFLPVSAY